jgi:hypothetical protein
VTCRLARVGTLVSARVFCSPRWIRVGRVLGCPWSGAVGRGPGGDGEWSPASNSAASLPRLGVGKTDRVVVAVQGSPSSLFLV